MLQTLGAAPPFCSPQAGFGKRQGAVRGDGQNGKTPRAATGKEWCALRTSRERAKRHMRTAGELEQTKIRMQTYIHMF